MKIKFIPFLIFLLFSEPGFSQGKYAFKKPPKTFSLTFSPLHLFLPVLEVTGEFKLEKRFGIAPILGVGSIKSKDSDSNNRFSAFEVGLQANYYVIGEFEKGMQIGAELLFVNVSGAEGDVQGMGKGVAIGPFVGYKIVAKGGFTFFIQAGYQIAAIKAQAQSSWDKEEKSESKGIFLLNINIGWSF